MRRADNAPIGNTCPDIDSVINVLSGVADRIDQIASRLSEEFAGEIDDLETQAMNLRQLFEGRRSNLEELRSANETLRSWGNTECERAEDALADVKALQRQVSELEDMR